MDETVRNEFTQTDDENYIISEENEKLIAGFKLMDDDFFSEVLDGKTAAVERIIRIVLGKDDIKVIDAKSQVEYHSALKRSITLDIKAVDSNERVYDVEIQRADKGADAKRARFHSSTMDRELLKKNEDFGKLGETYVIFITENDKYGLGLPLYHIDRTIKEMEHAYFGDGAHIIYVNGEYRDISSPVGILMHDFHCTNAGDMMIPELANEVKYFKETERGRIQVCRAVEERVEKARYEARHEARLETLRDDIVKVMKSFNVSVEDAMKALKVDKEDQAILMKMI